MPRCIADLSSQMGFTSIYLCHETDGLEKLCEFDYCHSQEKDIIIVHFLCEMDNQFDKLLKKGHAGG